MLSLTETRIAELSVCTPVAMAEIYKQPHTFTLAGLAKHLRASFDETAADETIYRAVRRLQKQKWVEYGAYAPRTPESSPTKLPRVLAPTPAFGTALQNADAIACTTGDTYRLLYGLAVEDVQRHRNNHLDNFGELLAQANYAGKAAVLGAAIDLNQLTDGKWFPGFQGWQLLIELQSLAPSQEQ